MREVALDSAATDGMAYPGPVDGPTILAPDPRDRRIAGQDTHCSVARDGTRVALAGRGLVVADLPSGATT